MEVNASERETSLIIPGILLDNLAVQIRVSCVEKLGILEAIRDVRSSELRHFLEFSELSAKLDMREIVQTSVAIHRDAKSGEKR